MRNLFWEWTFAQSDKSHDDDDHLEKLPEEEIEGLESRTNVRYALVRVLDTDCIDHKVARGDF